MSHRANPDEPRVAERLARLYLKVGQVDSASEIYTQVLATDPNRTRARAAGRQEREHVPWREVIRSMGHPQMLAFFTAQFLANFTRGVNRGGLMNLYAGIR